MTHSPAVASIDETAVMPAVEIIVHIESVDEMVLRQLAGLEAFARTGLPWPARISVLLDGGAADPAFTAAIQATVGASEFIAMSQGSPVLTVRQQDPETPWPGSATVVVYLDVDHLGDPSVVLPVLAAVMSGHSQIALGVRSSASSQVMTRQTGRLPGRAALAVMRAGLGARFANAGCGLLAIRGDRVGPLHGAVRSTGSFERPELLLRAERARLRIYRFPPRHRTDGSGPGRFGDLDRCGGTDSLVV